MAEQKGKMNIFQTYKQLGLKFWEYPHVLFTIFSIIVILVTYVVAPTFIIEKVRAMIFVSITIAGLLIIFGYLITVNFNRIVEAYQLESELKSIVAHQLWTPLVNFKWALAAIIEKRIEAMETNEEITRLIKVLHDCTETMILAVDAFLVISRIETGTLILRREPFSLSVLTQNEVDNSRIFAESYQINLEFKDVPNLPQVSADRVYTTMVIQDLISNAISYSHGPANVSINIEMVDDSYLRWIITDKGIGISKEEQKNIFSKYFRAENARKKQAVGAGIGLYIAKSIIDMSHGQIGFESQENKGSTFWFTLPIAK